MTGLALAGGGARGAYQIGVYMALKKCHIKIDGYAGTSIGAFNAAMLAAKRDKELLLFWQTVNIGLLLGLSEEYLKEINNKKINIETLKESINYVKNIILNKGFSTSKLKALLEELDIKKTLYASEKDFGLVTVNASELKPLYLFKEDIKPNLLNDYILASCYLPIFKMEKIVDDKFYLDGGFYDNMPVNSLLKRGYNQVYAVDLKAIGIKKKYLDKEKVIVIRPSRSLGSILTLNQEKINNNIKLGYYDGMKVLKKLDGYKYIFKKRNDWYYKFLLREVNKKMLGDMKKFFGTKDSKKLIIKALEYVMTKEKYDYYHIYAPYEVINKIKKSSNNYGVYRFIKYLKII